MASGHARRALAALMVCASLLGAGAPALAVAGCPRTTELAMETKLMCQVCGVPLALANSLEADRERALVTKLVARCETPAQIEAEMVAQYGPSVLASPGSHGFAIAAWLVPVVGIAGAVLAIAGVVALARRRRRGNDGAFGAEPVTAAEDARLDAALAKLDAPR